MSGAARTVRLVGTSLDAMLLAAAAALYNGWLYVHLTTGRTGFAVHQNVFTSGHDEFLFETVVGMIAGLAVLALVRLARLPSVVGFGLAAVASVYMGLPEATLFGTTWAPWEASRELFLAHPGAVTSVVVLVTLLRQGLWGIARGVRRPAG